MKFYLICFYSIFSLSCLASDETTNNFLFKNLALSIGNWSEYNQSVQINKTGGLNSFEDFDFRPFVSIALEFPIYPKLSLIPEIGYIFQKDNEQREIEKNHFFLKVDLCYEFKDWIRLRGGSSLMINTYSGQGGELNIDGPLGNQTFFIASERRTSLNQTLDFSIEVIFNKLSLKFANYIYAFIDEQDRMISHSISINYLIPFKEL